MKFLCRQCDQAMKLVTAEGPQAGSMTVAFACPGCGHEIAMLTNPEETNLVRALGVQVGAAAGPREPVEPMAHVRAALRRQRAGAFVTEPPGAAPTWTAEATDRLGRIPAFIRDTVKQQYEDFAGRHGVREITPQLMDEARDSITP